MVSSFLIYISIVWFKLNIVALAMFFFRKDIELVKKDIRTFLFRPFPYWVLSLVLIYLSLPFSIIYSVAHLIKWKK